MDAKRCTACHEIKPLTEFHRAAKNKDGLQYQCKECVKARVRAWYHGNSGENRKKQIARRVKWKLEVLAHYGGRCACCGVLDHRFLTFDHINGGGRKHREQDKIGGHLLMWLRRNDYPDGYQVLCWNCNCARAQNGGICPHQE